MPKIDIAKAAGAHASGVYPPPLPVASPTGARRQALGDAAGLTQFGVNLTRLKPGAASAQRHWHEQEDEFVYVLEGELVLIEDDGETVLGPATPRASRPASPNGHHLVNRSHRDALCLEIGTRAGDDRCRLSRHRSGHGTRRQPACASAQSGEPYPARSDTEP